MKIAIKDNDMTFQERFLVSHSKLANLFSDFGLELRKYGASGGDIQPIECTRGEFETSTGTVLTWFACVTEGPVHKTKPAILMLGNWYSTEEITSEEEFRKYVADNSKPY